MGTVCQGRSESRFQLEDDELYIRLSLEKNGRCKEGHMRNQGFGDVPSFLNSGSKRAICAGEVRMLIVSYIKGKTGLDYGLIGFADNESK